MLCFVFAKFQYCFRYASLTIDFSIKCWRWLSGRRSVAAHAESALIETEFFEYFPRGIFAISRINLLTNFWPNYGQHVESVLIPARWWVLPLSPLGPRGGIPSPAPRRLDQSKSFHARINCESLADSPGFYVYTCLCLIDCIVLIKIFDIDLGCVGN